MMNRTNLTGGFSNVQSNLPRGEINWTRTCNFDRVLDFCRIRCLDSCAGDSNFQSAALDNHRNFWNMVFRDSFSYDPRAKNLL